MNVTFYLAAIVAVIATINVITQLNAIHALLYLVVSLLAVAIIFFVLGAPFAAALEVIIYAGAIMVLFVFVVMMLNLGPESIHKEKIWMRPRIWFGPTLLTTILLIELMYLLSGNVELPVGFRAVSANEVGATLYGPYLLGVELASVLLLAGLVGAHHLGRRFQSGPQHKGEM